ncbi:MAG: glutamine synthetase family protein [Lachnospiraceae bacterium]|nr:glutamine synthetase family protein [Lachnospiraceae bacterium]
MRTKADILRMIEEEDVEFIRLQFTDILGNLKNIAITPNQLERAMEDMYPIKAEGVFGEEYFYPGTLYLHPDYDTFVILPWRPQQEKVAKLVCDVRTADGKCFPFSPRRILKNVLEKSSAQGYTFMVNPECEFFLFHTDDNGLPTTISHDRAGYMDVGPVDFGENARRDIVLMLEKMDFDVLSSHHENAPAQHEVDFGEREALKCADDIQTFRFAVRSVAKRFGLYATFMPKPKTEDAGAGMHTNFVLMKDGKNIFRNPDGGISDIAYEFVAGIMHHAKALSAISNPIVNSYKRLLGGYGAPSEIGWSERNDNAMVTIDTSFGDVKVKIRTPDGASNPYLLMAAVISAGLDGVENHMSAGVDIDESEDGVEILPGNLKIAIDAFAEDKCLREALGDEFINIYNEIKNNEWDEYMKSVSEWELDRYLTRM